MTRNRLPRSGVVLVLGAVLLTSGCTAATQRSAISTADWTTWSDRMDAVLHDPSGQGGASGLTPGSVLLESAKQGTYELVSACTGVDIIHVTARAGGKVLAETDVPCGAAVTVTLTYDVSSPLELRATAHSRGAVGAFWIGVNRSGWKQPGAIRFG